MLADEIAARYTQPGKQRIRQWVVDMARADDCQTVLDLWGGGTSARMFAARGMRVVSAEIESDWFPAMDADAAAHGYTAHHGPIRKVPGTFDLVWYDGTGHVSWKMQRELEALVSKVGRWLVVTLNPEREADRFLVQQRASAIPAWLITTTGLRLDYITRYVRNGKNQEMWLAVLSTRGRTAHVPLYPQTVARNLASPRRRYWVGHTFAQRFRGLGLVPWNNLATDAQEQHARPCQYCGGVFTPNRRRDARACPKPECQRDRVNEGQRRNHARRKVTLDPKGCEHCQRLFQPLRANQKFCRRYCSQRSAMARWSELDRARQRKYHRDYQARQRAAARKLKEAA